MKHLRGAASGESERASADCFAMLADIESYPGWYPEVVRTMQVVQRDEQGAPVRAETTLHLSRGPLVKDFELLLALDARPPSRVMLSRVPHGPPDGEEFEVTWRLEDRGSTHIELELRASVAVPRLLPVGDLADAFARGFVDAAIKQLASRA